MIVAGGTADLQGLYSTEILTMGAKAWTTVTPLPRYLKYPRMVTLNNKVYITGTEQLYMLYLCFEQKVGRESQMFSKCSYFGLV